ncbi:MAG: SagB/ThcOx family dehydrogenase [Muribaculaceae bacterium]|nr:SagB/ThcOx family dehydrogenase [Muribaculaceae bacterium]
MKKYLFAAMALIAINMNSQDINLPVPQPGQPAMTVPEALAARHSVREFSSRDLNEQELSNLCWAACGVVRDGEHRTAPSALNRQEIVLLVFTQRGVYEYDAYDNKLIERAKGNHRHLVAGTSNFMQDFVLNAPVTLVMVIDFNKFIESKDVGYTTRPVRDEHSLMMCCVDAGNVSENINLYCQSVGLATVPRATMDVEAIKELLHYDDSYLPIMNNPVGYPK